MNKPQTVYGSYLVDPKKTKAVHLHVTKENTLPSLSKSKTLQVETGLYLELSRII